MSETPKQSIGKEEIRKLTLLMNGLIENDDSLEFRQPVDVKTLGLLDYFDIVKQPMDLGTIKKNIKANKFKYVEDIFDMIQLVWDNCKTYNKEGSWIYNLAIKMEKYSKKLMKTYFPQIQPPKSYVNKENVDQSGGEDEGDRVTYTEKVKLSQQVKSLTQEQLGEEDCPSAFKEAEKDKFQILVDNLTKEVFDNISYFIEKCLASDTTVDQPTKKVKHN